MYFPTNNHYFDDSQNSQNFANIVENNDCLICLEINDKTHAICIKIQNKFYKKDCLCDGWIHQYCLDFWYIQNKKCPICLCKMTKNDENEINDLVITIHDRLITNIISTFYKIFRYFLYMYLLINFMFFLYCVFY